MGLPAEQRCCLLLRELVHFYIYINRLIEFRKRAESLSINLSGASSRRSGVITFLLPDPIIWVERHRPSAPYMPTDRKPTIPLGVRVAKLKKPQLTNEFKTTINQSKAKSEIRSDFHWSDCNERIVRSYRGYPPVKTLIWSPSYYWVVVLFQDNKNIYFMGPKAKRDCYGGAKL